MIGVKEKSMRDPLNASIPTGDCAMGRLEPWDLFGYGLRQCSIRLRDSKLLLLEMALCIGCCFGEALSEVHGFQGIQLCVLMDYKIIVRIWRCLRSLEIINLLLSREIRMY
jgi:hypothetical protein